MDDLTALRCILRYETVLHRLKVKYSDVNDKDLEYTQKDLYTAMYNIYIFHKSLADSNTVMRIEMLKQMRNFIKIMIKNIKKNRETV